MNINNATACRRVTARRGRSHARRRLARRRPDEKTASPSIADVWPETRFSWVARARNVRISCYLNNCVPSIAVFPLSPPCFGPTVFKLHPFSRSSVPFTLNGVISCVTVTAWRLSGRVVTNNSIAKQTNNQFLSSPTRPVYLWSVHRYCFPRIARLSRSSALCWHSLVCRPCRKVD